MRIVHGLAFVFIAVWFLLTGVLGLAGIAVSPVLAVIINLLALLAGIFLLITIGKCCCDCTKCVADRNDPNRKF